VSLGVWTRRRVQLLTALAAERTGSASGGLRSEVSLTMAGDGHPRARRPSTGGMPSTETLHDMGPADWTFPED